MIELLSDFIRFVQTHLVSAGLTGEIIKLVSSEQSGEFSKYQIPDFTNTLKHFQANQNSDTKSII